jgi:hypothetical protein
MQIGIGDGARAAGAFGDVLPGHFQVHAAGIGAFGRWTAKNSFTSFMMRSNGRVL